MKNNIFDFGIIVGRFQHIHIGHEKIINIGLSLCNKLLVFVGSSQIENTIKNPYNVEYRIELITKIYRNEIKKGRLILSPLIDLENKDELSPKWGKYVISQAKELLGSEPSVIIYGKDKDIFKCFDKKTVKNITEILVDRNIMDISATKIRELLLKDDFLTWKKFANPKIYSEYNNLKNIIDNVKGAKNE